MDLSEQQQAEVVSELIVQSYKKCRKVALDKKHQYNDLSNDEVQIMKNCVSKFFYLMNSPPPAI